MKVVELTAPRLDAFRATSHPDPSPGPGEVLIRLRAASLNFLDIAVATGKYPISNFPIFPVTDAAGEISASCPELMNLGIRFTRKELPDGESGVGSDGRADAPPITLDGREILGGVGGSNGDRRHFGLFRLRSTLVRELL